MQDVVYVNTPDKQQHGLVSCIQAEGLKPTLLLLTWHLCCIAYNSAYSVCTLIHKHLRCIKNAYMQTTDSTCVHDWHRSMSKLCSSTAARPLCNGWWDKVYTTLYMLQKCPADDVCKLQLNNSIEEFWIPGLANIQTHQNLSTANIKSAIDTTSLAALVDQPNTDVTL